MPLLEEDSDSVEISAEAQLIFSGTQPSDDADLRLTSFQIFGAEFNDLGYSVDEIQAFLESEENRNFIIEFSKTTRDRIFRDLGEHLAFD